MATDKTTSIITVTITPISAGSPAGKLADAEPAVAHHHHPVKQRRLLKPLHATERRRDEIAALEHLAGDLSIARFIRSDERKRTQPIKINSAQAQEKDFPTVLGKFRSWQV